MRDHGFYDFDAKYISKSSVAVTRCPADLPKGVRERLRALAVKAFWPLTAKDYPAQISSTPRMVVW